MGKANSILAQPSSMKCCQVAGKPRGAGGKGSSACTQNTSAKLEERLFPHYSLLHSLWVVCQSNTLTQILSLAELQGLAGKGRATQVPSPLRLRQWENKVATTMITDALAELLLPPACATTTHMQSPETRPTQLVLPGKEGNCQHGELQRQVLLLWPAGLVLTQHSSIAQAGGGASPMTWLERMQEAGAARSPVSQPHAPNSLEAQST